jgi:hypothetical protein
MTGTDAALVIGLLFILILGVGVGGFLAARNPVFWIGFGKALAAAALPKIKEIVLKRNSPEIEAQMQACLRRGGEWDNFRKRCKD